MGTIVNYIFIGLLTVGLGAYAVDLAIDFYREFIKEEKDDQ